MSWRKHELAPLLAAGVIVGIATGAVWSIQAPFLRGLPLILLLEI
jgi:hypothetical protein